MILCVAPSPAWDVTYGLDRLREHATNRATSVAARAGGKAVNVARILHALGESAVVVAPVGGATGALFVDDLALAGVPLVAVPQDADLRRTMAFVSAETGDATLVNEPAPLLDWQEFLAVVDEQVGGAAVIVASGSLPLGAPDTAFSDLAVLGASHGVPVVVDTSGPSLMAALASSPTLVKPNREELAVLSGGADPVPAVQRIARSTGVAVAASLGGEGMVLAADDQLWQASCGETLRGNPTGAGDAAVAALARGIGRRTPWPDALADAVALSAAAVLATHAGEHAADRYPELLERVVVRQIDGAR